jgi:hypothetical protein
VSIPDSLKNSFPFPVSIPDSLKNSFPLPASILKEQFSVASKYTKRTVFRYFDSIWFLYIDHNGLRWINRFYDSFEYYMFQFSIYREVVIFLFLVDDRLYEFHDKVWLCLTMFQ